MKLTDEEIESAIRDPYAFVGDFRLRHEAAEKIRQLSEDLKEAKELAKFYERQAFDNGKW
jgi:hypothetical protein